MISGLTCDWENELHCSGGVKNGTVCVGAVLDNGKNIPKTVNYADVPAGQWRLYELFVQSFHTWLWNADNAKYGKNDEPKANDDLIDHSGPIAWDAPGTGVSEWKVNSKPPVVYNISVNGSSSDASLSPAASTAILHFHAYADNNQMPIVRMAVDWGDGSDPYVMQGWFKNRKKYCGVKVGNDYMVCEHKVSPKYYDRNKPCVEAADCGTDFICEKDDNRLYFGSSPAACEEGYYQFTHIYECPGKATPKVPACAGTVTTNCWNAAKSACIFTPKVQVLDNWGWCNSSDGNGRWNDNAKIDDDKNCRTKKDNTENPWTSFGGTIKVTP